jgi:2-haloacid dehalogenase
MGIPPAASRVPVFDFGGVVFDWNPRHLFRRFFEGDSDAMERFLTEIGFESRNAELDRGRPFAEVVNGLIETFPWYAEPIRAFDSCWMETVRGPMNGMEDLVRRLIGAGRPVCALSNFSAEKYPLLRRKYSFLGAFRYILLSGEAGILKPDPRIFDLFLQRSGLRKQAPLFVDDSQVNVSAARSLGWDSIVFSSAAQLEKELTDRRML